MEETKEKIIDIYKKKLNQKVLNLKDSSLGVDQKVFIVKTGKGKSVIKLIGNNPTCLNRGYYGLKYIAKLDLPGPRILAKGKDYMIETLLEGKPLGDVKYDKKTKEKIYFKLGQLIKELHSKKSKGYGDMSSWMKAKHKSLKKYYDSWILDEFKRFEREKFFTKQELLKIRKFYSKNITKLDLSRIVPLHLDIDDVHIFVKNKKFVGLIDYGDFSSGPPLADIWRVYLNYYETYKFNSFIKGYGNVNLKELEFYVFVNLSWWINFVRDNKKPIYKRALKYYKRIVGLK